MANRPREEDPSLTANLLSHAAKNSIARRKGMLPQFSAHGPTLTVTRTHRERKELYIKALEQEVLRLKEAFSTTTRERDQVMEENRRLKELLAAHNISYDFGSSPIKFRRENSDRGHFGYGPSSSGSISGSYAGTSEHATYSPPLYGSTHSNPLPSVSPPHHQDSRRPSQVPDNQLDYDQIGIDFVLTYDSQGRPIRTPLGRDPPAPYPSPPPHH